MPLEWSEQRTVIEEQAQELGRDPEDHIANLANQVTLAKLGVVKVIQKMATGQLEPDIKDGIAFANFLDRVEERSGSGLETVALQEMIQVFFDAVMAEVGMDHVEAIARRAEGDPRMEWVRKKLVAAQSKA